MSDKKFDLKNFLAPFIQKYPITKFGALDTLEPKSYSRYQEWVKKGHAGVLNYLSDERMAQRKSLLKVFPKARQTIIFAFDYSPAKSSLNSVYKESVWNKLKLASYTVAFPEDYHHSLKKILEEIALELKNLSPELDYKLALDVLPILERDFAYQAGLGWVGKNSMLIDKEYGSYFLIGSILLSESLFQEQNNVEVDHCGTCTACIDACPTNAIDPFNRTLIADKCISTFTIEIFKDSPAPKGMENSNGEFFGCDICQEVCPWNQKRLEKITPVAFNHPLIDFFLTRKFDEVFSDMEQISIKGFKNLFAKFPLSRSGKRGLLKNLRFWKNHSSNSWR